MKDDSMKIEQRLQNMKNFYTKVGDLLDNLPDAIPEKARQKIRDTILGDEELKNLMDGVDSHRPPRIFLIGRTGVGKSSLINALCSAYVAPVSDTRSCTETAQTYQCKDGERTLMEILDTRGIAESDNLNAEISAEDMLINQVKEFSPDVAIFMLNCTHRDDVDSDVNFLKKLSESYAQAYNMRLPIVAVVNKCDEMAPSRLKNPNEYTESKTKKIAEQVQHYKEIIVKNNLKIDDIIAVSSLIDWMTADGTEIDADSIESLPVSDIENLQIAFDGRYHIEELLNILEKAILDFSARMGLRMALKLQEVVRRIANQLNKSFSAMSATVALSPIPISDIYILLLLQGILVCLIASLSGRDISLDTAKEFVLSMGGIAGAGYGFRLLAQQASKILNVFWAGSGSAVSASIAALGTSAIGKAAIAYYIDDKTIEEAKSTFEASRKED
ncbi:GTPase [Faecalibacterium sp. HTF-128]|uniref:GTPase n=1 Tax=Faecalibacterium wellingii TaxID=2929491 RepID=A0AB35Y7P4_9FIRM